MVAEKLTLAFFFVYLFFTKMVKDLAHHKKNSKVVKGISGNL